MTGNDSPERGSLLPAGGVEQLILLLRGRRVMLDEDLARLYGVQTKALNQAVRRNPDRFPEDFMFRFGNEEWRRLKSQFVTAKGRGGRRNSRAAQVNIEIMRTFSA